MSYLTKNKTKEKSKKKKKNHPLFSCVPDNKIQKRPKRSAVGLQDEELHIL